MSFADEWNHITERVAKHEEWGTEDRNRMEILFKLQGERIEALERRVGELDRERLDRFIASERTAYAEKFDPPAPAATPTLLAAAEEVVRVWDAGYPWTFTPAIAALRDAVAAEPARQAEHEAAVRELVAWPNKFITSPVLRDIIARVEATL